MSYAGLGVDIGGTVSGSWVAARDMARTQAVEQARSVGVPDNVFYAIDDIAVKGIDARDVFRTRGIDTARSLLAQNGAQFEKTTGVPIAAIDAILQGIQTGDTKAAALQSASIMGGALGTAACGPVCGAVVSTLATGVVKAVDNFVGVWVTGDWDAQNRAEREARVRANAQARQNLKQMAKQYNALEKSVVYAAQLGPARIYNDLLGLGVSISVEKVASDTYNLWANFYKLPDSAPDWSRNAGTYRGLVYDGGYLPDMTRRADAAARVAAQEQSIVQASLGGRSRESFEAANDLLRVEDTLLLAVRKAFIDAVKQSTDAKYPGLWDRNNAESGFFARIEKWIVTENSGNGTPGSGTNPNVVPPGESLRSLFCDWSDPGIEGFFYGPARPEDALRCGTIYSPAVPTAKPAILPDQKWAPGFIPTWASGYVDPGNVYHTGCWPNYCGDGQEYEGSTDFCFGSQARLRAWMCHFPRHYQYMQRNVNDIAFVWGKAATRDIAILQMGEAMRKAKTDATSAAALALAKAQIAQVPPLQQQRAVQQAVQQVIQEQVSAWGKVRNAITGKTLTSTQKAVAIAGVGLLGAGLLFLLLPDAKSKPAAA